MSVTSAIGFSAAFAAMSFVAGSAPLPIVRTVYVTVTDASGAAVPGLAAADFTITEGGTDRQVQKAAPATARMHLTVMVEEWLADDSVRTGIFLFAKRLQPFAKTAVIAIGHRTTTLADYTTDLNAIAAGLNRFSLLPQAQSNFTEALLDVTQTVERQRPERPVIVVVTRAVNRDGGASAKDVLDHLRQSGAMLYAVAIVDAPTTSEQLPTVGVEGDRLVAEPSRREEVPGRGDEAVRRPSAGGHGEGRRAEGAAADRGRLEQPVRDSVHVARRRQARPPADRQRQAVRRLPARADSACGSVA